MQKFFDLTHIVEDDMPVYPGDEKVRLHQTKYLYEDKHNNHKLEISMHAGTHIDGPMHLTESKAYISEFSLDDFTGIGCVLDVRNESKIQMKSEYEEKIPEESIVLLYTGYDKKYGKEEYYKEHPVVTKEFANLLIKKRVKILGMDMPSPDYYPFEIHKLLLNNKIFIIENLTNVDKLLAVEKFEIMAFPLKMKADGSMLRVVAKVMEG